ncbi:gluconolaconase [Mycolicibacterium moriokaense]|uniref:Gluconolactonase n=1 Tax=Mycolicibacterium moriokaense TaxID=39691 RepID=A0AAD1M909_9MYCO|nr:SMP-30/gluconolactonase/LRE family protein [Mycolicibacterium moriokaense]MCV7042531.1 SMP-30/gluconolactonase/LRE family protein [Mycolicibacterium moriokaense]ORB16986.1 gluconolaconase [Mycolicibacterium moriokaense]BBX04065.1 gluconolactonase [Mycolicibacterium moriokaense]
MTLSADRVTVPVAYHGEGPFWDAISGRLLSLDVLAGVIVALDSAGGLSRYQVPSRVAAVVRRRALGGFAIVTEHGLVGANEQLSAFERIAGITDDPNVRSNDGGCDPLGGFVIGTMAYDERPGGGAVYRVTPDHQVVQLLSPVSISNGVQWSADGSRVYYIDTPTRRVDVFDVDPETGAWLGRRRHVDLDGTPGYPDGMAIDEDDGLWIALWGGGAVNHYDAAGRLVETIRIPGVTQVSSCTFGGDGRDVLYVTTSRQGLPDDHEPSAGAIFALRTHARGAAAAEFAG